MCGVKFLLFVYAEEGGMRRRRRGKGRCACAPFNIIAAHNIRDAPAAAASRLSDKHCYNFLPLSY